MVTFFRRYKLIGGLGMVGVYWSTVLFGNGCFLLTTLCRRSHTLSCEFSTILVQKLVLRNNQVSSNDWEDHIHISLNLNNLIVSCWLSSPQLLLFYRGLANECPRSAGVYWQFILTGTECMDQWSSLARVFPGRSCHMMEFVKQQHQWCWTNHDHQFYTHESLFTWVYSCIVHTYVIISMPSYILSYTISGHTIITTLHGDFPWYWIAPGEFSRHWLLVWQPWWR